MSSAVLFTYGFLALLMAVNALRPPSPPTSRFPALWLPAVLLSEAPWLWLVVRTVVALGLIALGALSLSIGRAGLLFVLAAQLIQVELIRRSVVGAKLVSSDQADSTWWERFAGWPYRIPDTVERLSDLEYAHGLTLDLYRLKHPSVQPAPCLIYVHGGSWSGGDPRRQFRPVIHHLASRGWVIVAIRYPVSPPAIFPDHLVGVKNSIVWARTEGGTYGIDRDRIAIAGGSSGAHLAALAALSPGRFQPGFEQADTSVRAAVVLYGIYDFANRNRTRYDWPVIPVRVMRASLAEAPDRYRDASPFDQVHRLSPPFLVVHGSHDSLVPPAEGRLFADALATAGATVELLELRWAQHAFDVMAGARTRALAVRIERFLDMKTFVSPDTESVPSNVIRPDTVSPDAAS